MARDARVSVLPSTTVTADGATNGSNLDLLGDYVGDYVHGTSMYGVPIELILSGVVTGIGDGFTVTVKQQVADDNGSGAPGSWIDHVQVGVFTIDTDGNILKEDGTTKLGLTRGKLQTRIRTNRAWARLVATAAGMSGGEQFDIKASLCDGTLVYADTGIIH